MRRAARDLFDLTFVAFPARAGGLAVTLLVTALAPVAAAWLTRTVLDRVQAGAPLGAVLVPTAGVAAAAALVGLGPVLGGYLSRQLQRRVTTAALDRLFTAADRFVGLRPFEDPAFLDQFRLAQQGAQSAGLFVGDVLGAVSDAVGLAGFTLALSAVSPAMTGIVLAAAVPTVLGESLLARRRTRVLEEVVPRQRREFFYANLLCTVSAAKEVRLFGLGGFLRGRMLAERGAADTAEQGVDRRDALIHGGVGLLGALVAASGLLWAVARAREGAMTLGSIALFVASVAAVQGALAALVRDGAAVQQRLAVFRSYARILHSAPDLPLAAAPRPVAPLRTGVELRDVWFRYGPDLPWVLRGVTLTIPRGTALALVGVNGAGKSTVAKLLGRLYDPERGAVLWDGTDIRDFDPAEYRGRLSAVFQDFASYEFSAADNIAVGDLARREEPAELARAAELAGVHGLLAGLPDGYDTHLTRGFASAADKADARTGVVLSGGQWQRVALARAFLRRDRDLTILDEPSSGLDPEAEHDVHQRVTGHRGDSTALLVSHRFNAIREADLIAVLDEGRIVELGDHAGLVAADGRYAQLFALQASGYTRDTPAAAAGVGTGTGTGAGAPARSGARA
ncbi:ABC transporter ATP-binding protein [Kitasatospora phosalacinea]|uniref:ABC transporter ATP-binding protein n=1 Tax=Kitasatospora phosalacinea TaxID=2065 RepID=UPI003660137D